MRILIVEDEKKTSAYLKKGLSENGFIVDVADQGEDGLRCALRIGYDLVILDIMLPKQDGWSVIAEIRRSGKQTQVLFLTARHGSRSGQGTRIGGGRLHSEAIRILGIARSGTFHPPSRSDPAI